MLQENVEVVRRVLGLWNAGGVRAGRGGPSSLTQRFEWIFAGARSTRPSTTVMKASIGLPPTSPRSGISSRSSWWNSIDADPHVVSVMQVTGRGQGSGIEVESQLAWVWTLRDGRILRVEGDFDRESALEAAGLNE